MKFIKNPLILGVLFIIVYTLYLDKCALQTCDERIKEHKTIYETYIDSLLNVK